MFLSNMAKALLDTGRYDALQNLDWRELLDADSVSGFNGNDGLFQESMTQSQLSGPEAARDPVTFDITDDVAVGSDGHIYPLVTLLQLLEEVEPKGPISREKLNPAVMVSLPQIKFAIASWKLIQVMKRTHDHVPQALTFMISADMVHLSIRGSSRPLRAYLGHVFSDCDNNKGEGRYNSYDASEWTFAWSAVGMSTTLEFWIDQDNFNDADVLELMAKTLAPLAGENDDDVPITAQIIKMGEIPKNADVKLTEPLSIDPLQASQCCAAFINHLSRLRKQRSPEVVAFKDAIVRYKSSAPPASDLGLMAIGAVSVVASQSMASAAMSSQSQSQVMSQAAKRVRR